MKVTLLLLSSSNLLSIAVNGAHVKMADLRRWATWLEHVSSPAFWVVGLEHSMCDEYLWLFRSCFDVQLMMNPITTDCECCVRQDHISNHRGRHLLPKNWGLMLKFTLPKFQRYWHFPWVETSFIKYAYFYFMIFSRIWVIHVSGMTLGILLYRILKVHLSATCCIAQHRLKTWQIYRWIFAHNFTYTCPNDLNDPSF